MTGLQKLRKKQEQHTLIDNVLPFHYQDFMLNYHTGKNSFYEEYVQLPNDDFKFPFNYWSNPLIIGQNLQVLSWNNLLKYFSYLSLCLKGIDMGFYSLYPNGYVQNYRIF